MYLFWHVHVWHRVSKCLKWEVSDVILALVLLSRWTRILHMIETTDKSLAFIFLTWRHSNRRHQVIPTDWPSNNSPLTMNHQTHHSPWTTINPHEAGLEPPGTTNHQCCLAPVDAAGILAVLGFLRVISHRPQNLQEICLVITNGWWENLRWKPRWKTQENIEKKWNHRNSYKNRRNSL